LATLTVAGREIGLSQLTVRGAGSLEVIEAAGRAGFDSVGLRLIDDRAREPVPLVGDTALRREVIARLDHGGLRVLDVEVVRLADARSDPAWPEAFESAAHLGARNVLVVCWDRDLSRAAAAFAAACEAAGGFGLRCALEFMPFSGVRTLAEAVRLVEAAPPAGGVLVDALHLHRSGATPSDVAAVIAARPDTVPYVQLCDAPRQAPAGLTPLDEAVGHRLQPGEGELPLGELLAALPSSIPISVEVTNPAMATLAAVDRAQRAMAATLRLLRDAGQTSHRLANMTPD
jgi:sugar phosphate isomerase/epimerase